MSHHFLPIPLAQRFWQRVDQSAGPDACWLWTAYRNEHGYGVVAGVEGRTVLTHRAAFALTNGPIPDGLNVLHSCDNPPCCNPEHLWLGTQQDNVQDRDEKGRAWFQRRLDPAALARARGLARTHCNRGHLLDEGNTYRPPGKPFKRACRACNRENTRRYREREAVDFDAQLEPDEDGPPQDINREGLPEFNGAFGG